MTSPRIFPTDKPERQTYARKATVRARIDTQTYLVDFFDNVGGTEAAHYPGSTLLARGTLVRCIWSNEGGVWMIVGGVGARVEEGEDCNGLPFLHVLAGEERHDVCTFDVHTFDGFNTFINFSGYNDFNIHIEPTSLEDLGEEFAYEILNCSGIVTRRLINEWVSTDQEVNEADLNIETWRDINISAGDTKFITGETPIMIGRDLNMRALRNVNISADFDRLNMRGSTPPGDISAIVIDGDGDVFITSAQHQVVLDEEDEPQDNGDIYLAPNVALECGEWLDAGHVFITPNSGPDGDGNLTGNGFGNGSVFISPFSAGVVEIAPWAGDVIVEPGEGDVEIIPTLGDVNIEPAAGDVTIDPAGTFFAKYSPANPSDWSGTPPTTLAEAIDRIAAVVAAQHGAIA